MTERPTEVVDLPEEDEGPDMNEGTEFAENRPLVNFGDLDEGDDDEFETETINPYDIPVTDCNVIFTTHISEASSLGEVAEVVALNIIRFGLDAYNILFTDTETGKQYISRGGLFVESPLGDIEGDVIEDDEDDEADE